MLTGGMGVDRLERGHGGGDKDYGGMMDDMLMGGDAKDLLDGGAGHDMLDSGMGNDTMRGGTGADAKSLCRRSAISTFCSRIRALAASRNRNSDTSGSYNIFAA